MKQPATERLYDRDFALWVDAQAAALRDKRFGDLDLPNLTEVDAALAGHDFGGLEAVELANRTRARRRAP